MNNIPTPSMVCKIYRQVLRYAGSSVLYAHPARLNLRALYRPEFDIWMNKAKIGEEQAIKDKPEWEEFSRRVGNTIAMLHHSSNYTGTTPHTITSNLAHMRYHMDPPAHVEAHRGGTMHLSTLRLSRPEFIQGKKAKRKAEVEKLFAWDAFAETLGMAEGSAGLMLGKAKPRPRGVELANFEPDDHDESQK